MERQLQLVQQGAAATGESWRDHWRTPKYILERVDSFFDGKWFDPCPPMPAFDGLKTPWLGNTFINPPFSKYAAWAEFGSRQRGAQIWLCNTNNDTLWFQKLLENATAICLLNKRVRFIDPRTNEVSKSSAIGKAQSLIYTGHYAAEFANEFWELGYIVELKGGRGRV